MKLIELKEAAEKSTPSPWISHFADDSTVCNCTSIIAEYGGMGSIFDVNVCKKEEGPWGDDIGPLPDVAKANAKFLVGSRELTPKMIDLLERIDKDLEKVLKELDWETEHAHNVDLIRKIQRSIRDL